MTCRMGFGQLCQKAQTLHWVLMDIFGVCFAKTVIPISNRHIECLVEQEVQ